MVIVKNLLLASLLPLSLCSMGCHASERGAFSPHHFYLGVFGGYASTTWQGLVPTQENQNLALNVSTPIHVTEGGGGWGVFAGHQFTPAFAIELGYMHYPNAQIAFDPSSVFSFENNELTTFSTKTETISLTGKILLPIYNTSLRLFSSAGAAGVHRNDLLVNDWRLSPTFSVGLNSPLGKHFLTEIVGNYTTGYGESQLSPVNTYFPFLYSVVVRLAYCF
jgi:hypothetical protein